MSDNLTPAAYIFGHLIPRGPSPQTQADRDRESARRKGRHRKNWWQDYPVQLVPDSKPKPE